MLGSSSETQVPCSHVNAERTCSRTPKVRATSTERIAGLGQPVAVISSNSSKEMADILRASGHHSRIGGEYAGHIGVELARVGSEHVRHRDRRGIRTATAQERHIRDSVETPWEPAITGTRPLGYGRPARDPGRISRILALRWAVSVMKPAWLPVKLSAWTCRGRGGPGTSARWPCVRPQ